MAMATAIWPKGDLMTANTDLPWWGVKFLAGVGIWSAALVLRWGRVQPDLRENADPGALEAVLLPLPVTSPERAGGL